MRTGNQEVLRQEEYEKVHSDDKGMWVFAVL